MIDERTIAQPKVTVYSTPTCPYCVMAKRYLAERGIKYEDVDVAADQARALEMLTKSGQMGVPVLDIGGQVIVGFNRPAIDDALMSRR
ncbi:MAG: glutathione S-transferase N-terminal domain-containing protein [Candidatus Micrarchaeota archaeon]|nr:glutathione S-transferase N-terminal domain-containing protein [Candidatus Micrarchaeota archaeon]